MKGTNISSFRPPVLALWLRIAHSTFRQSLRDKVFVCFNIVTSKLSLFQWLFTCMYGRTQSELYSQHWRVIHKEASGRHLLCPALILLVLFSTFLDQRQKQDRPSFFFLCFIFVCNLKMLFLPFQNTDEKKEEAHSDLCRLWQLFDFNWGCFYKLVVH